MAARHSIANPRRSVRQTGTDHHADHPPSANNISPPPNDVKPRKHRLSGQEKHHKAALSGMWQLEDEPGTYLPSPETIAAECAAIRAGWSDVEHRYRAAMLPTLGEGHRVVFNTRQKVSAWTPPVYRCGLRGAE